MFEITFSNNAEKFLGKCESKIRERLKGLFESLSQNPVPAKHFDLTKISGLEDTYRIRLSSYRVVYTVYWEQKIIRVIKIEIRKERTYKF